MKYLIIALTLLFASCNRDTKIELTEEQKQQELKSKNDSLMVVFDSLMSMKIELPKVVDYSVIDSTCNKQFVELAKQTDGNVTILLNAKFISKEIIKIIESNSTENADILFLIDKTSSMDDDLENIKKGLTSVLASIKKYKNNRLAIACYGDKNSDGSAWFNYKNFETDYSSATSFINLISVTDGGDYPESVFDGFFEAMDKDFWKSDSKRIIVLIGDAPSLNPPKSSHTLEEVIQKAKENKINMNFYPILISPIEPELLSTETRMEEIKIVDNIFPNPSNGIVNIDFLKADDYEVELYNQEGKQIESTRINGNNYRKEMYDLPNGVYVFRIIDKNKNNDSKKIILQK